MLLEQTGFPGECPYVKADTSSFYTVIGHFFFPLFFNFFHHFTNFSSIVFHRELCN